MSNILIFDTETTGLPQRYRDYGHPDQPHLVQLAAILFDSIAGRVRAEINFLVHPQGAYAIPEGATAVHGIATEDAERSGIPLIAAMSAFHHLAKQTSLMVCHNIEFDIAIVRIAYQRLNKQYPLPHVSRLCTMAELTQIMHLPPTPRMVEKGMGHLYKAPSLAEAVAFIGRGPFDAHDGMADARETLAIYRWLEDRKANGAVVENTPDQVSVA